MKWIIETFPDLCSSTSILSMSLFLATANNLKPSLDFTHYTVLSFICALITTCLPQRSPLRRAASVLQIALVVDAYLAPPPITIPNTAVIHTFGTLLANLTARYVDRLYVHVPEKEFHRINSDGSKEDADKLSWARKLFWAFELFGVTRGVGWDWRVSGIPRAEPQTRSQFLRRRLSKYICMYAGLYLVGLSSQNIRNGFKNFSSPTARNALVDLRRGKGGGTGGEAVRRGCGVREGGRQNLRKMFPL